VNLLFIIAHIENESKDMCRNWLLQNDFENTFGEIRVGRFTRVAPTRSRGVPHDRARGTGGSPGEGFSSECLVLNVYGLGFRV